MYGVSLWFLFWAVVGQLLSHPVVARDFGFEILGRWAVALYIISGNARFPDFSMLPLGRVF